MKKWLVYIHISPSNKYYIGITSQKAIRRWGHNGKGYFNRHRPLNKQSHFWNAIQKYGWDKFKHMIVKDNLSKADAMKLEKKLIKQYKTQDEKYGYNLTSGGDGVRDYIITQEIKDRISKTLKNKYRNKQLINPMLGKHLRESTKQKLRNINLGKTYSKEVRDKHKRPAWNKGIPMSEKSKQHLSKTLKGRPAWNKGIKMKESSKIKLRKTRTIQSGIQISQYDLNNNFIKEYPSYEEAARQNNILSGSISQCIKGKTKTAGGYIWKKIT